jgi:hypothetical protein
MAGIVATVRDVAIIFLALESIVIGIILVILIWEVRNLAKMLREDIKPVLQSADETARTVRGTTTFVSENFVTPLVRVSSFTSGVVEALRIVTGRKK